ncbi:MAG: hypothetical protein FWH57_08580 [Oscillospiraceae bacterium]|nr:hypothetical protein [Oscillospiraceae bacterium]
MSDVNENSQSKQKDLAMGKETKQRFRESKNSRGIQGLRGLWQSRAPRVAIIASAFLAIAGIIIALLFAFDVLGGIDQTAYSVSYKIQPITQIGYLDVEMNIDVHRLSRDREIMLYKALVEAEYIECLDDADNDILFAETDDVFLIGPIEDSVKKLRFNYSVYVGAINAEYDVNSIPYSQGCILEDLISFSGEYTILLPFLDPNSFDSIGKYIKNITIEFIVPNDFDPIIPYQTPIDGQNVITVDKPDWDFFNTISKSAFSFGHFESLNDYVELEGAKVYVDMALIDMIAPYSIEALQSLIGYYTDIFGETLGDTPIVLLRSLDYEDTVIISGAGGGGSAMSANMRIADDVKTMSNMVFHTFFDSKVKPRNLRYPGNNWVYRGLSEYYVAASISCLSEDVIEEYAIGATASINERYLRYLYFSLKEPGFLAVSPVHETTGMYFSQEEFYMGVKVPLIIAAINYTAQQQTGQAEGLIRALVYEGGASKAIDVPKLLQGICGPDYEMIENYLSGQALVPNFLNLNIDYISAASILYLLDQDESMYASYFESQRVFYPYSAPILLNEEAFMKAVAERGIHYNTEEIQNEVRGFSSVLHRLLLQYAAWASLAGIDDITVPNIKYEITRTEVMDQWREFCNEIGIEYDTVNYNDIGYDEYY